MPDLRFVIRTKRKNYDRVMGTMVGHPPMIDHLLQIYVINRNIHKLINKQRNIVLDTLHYLL